MRTPPPAQPEQLLRKVTATGERELSIIADSAELALGGDPAAIRSYTEAFRALAHRVAAIAIEDPDDRRLLLLSAQTLGAAALVSPSTRRFGPALGVALTVVNALAAPNDYADALREALATTTLPDPSPTPSLETFRNLARIASQPTLPAEPLHEIRELFQLSSPELASLFSVSDQTIRNWLGGEVTPSQRTEIHLVHKSARLLAHNLLPERIPALVRLEHPTLGGHSVLGALRLGRHAEVLYSLRTLFNWGSLE